MSDLFEKENESVYSRYLIDLDTCPIELHETFITIFSLKEAIKQTKNIHEEIFLKPHDAHFYGSTSSFYGVATQKDMPSFWKKTDEMNNGYSLWKPNLSSVIGKRINDAFERICFNMDFTEELYVILKKYGFKIRKSDLNIVIELVEHNNNFVVELAIPHCSVTSNKNNLWILSN